MPIWQVPANNEGWHYHDVFLKYGVALIGPGNPGEWTHEQPDEIYRGSFVRRFANEMQPEDVLVLREGRSTIRAVGYVIGEYEYLEQFDGVNGWDLQHCRRVHWHELPNPHDVGRAVFSTRFSGVQDPDVVDFVNEFIENLPVPPNYVLPDLPEIEPELTRLLPNLQNVQELVAQIREFLDAYGNEVNNFGEEELSENETIAHFVVPFLRALGWPILNIAVEWRKIDITVFNQLPRTPENCRLVIEVKRLYSGIAKDAFDQARRSALDNDIIGEDRYIVVTDGIRYRLFKTNEGAEGEPNEIAYANLENLKESHIHLFGKLLRPR